MKPIARLALIFLLALACAAAETTRPRVLVSTDIGGTDPDDFQSMIHLLVCADAVELEGLVSSPYGPGRKQHILEVIEHYARDYPNLKAHSTLYPPPERLRSIAKQGALEGNGPAGFAAATEGSRWIVDCARRDDPRPLWVLVWGGIDDLAQALHDAPEIEPKLRVYFIGGPNKMWSVDAYNYLEEQHPRLWIIEANSTYRGWFVGGNQAGEWGNTAFVAAHVAGRGALGGFFATQLRGTIKMGDSPSVAYLLHGAPDDPERSGWGGRFVRAWEDRKTRFTRLTTAADEVEAFGVVEIALPKPAGLRNAQHTRLLIDGRIPAVASDEGAVLRFRFAPRDAKLWPYVVESDAPELAGKTGAFTAVPPARRSTQPVSARHPHWWIDDPAPEAAEGVHAGARHVNRWREDFLRDFAARMSRCRAVAPGAETAAADETAAAHLARAKQHWEAGRFDAARADLDRALALDPKLASAYLDRSYARQMLKDAPGAVEDAERALALEPENPRGFDHRGVARRALGDLAGALADFDRGIELDTRSVSLHGNRGAVRFLRGDVDGAIADFTRVIELQPGHLMAYLDRGAARGAKRDYAGQIADCTRALEIDPELAPAYEMRAQAKQAAGDFVGAMRDLGRAQQKAPRR